MLTLDRGGGERGEEGWREKEDREREREGGGFLLFFIASKKEIDKKTKKKTLNKNKYSPHTPPTHTLLPLERKWEWGIERKREWGIQRKRVRVRDREKELFSVVSTPSLSRASALPWTPQRTLYHACAKRNHMWFTRDLLHSVLTAAVHQTFCK